MQQESIKMLFSKKIENLKCKYMYVIKIQIFSLLQAELLYLKNCVFL